VALLLARLAGVAVLPLLSRAITPETLGRFAVLSSFLVVSFAALVDLGLGVAAIRLAAGASEAEATSWFRRALALRVVLGAAVAAGILVAARPLSRLLLGDDSATSLAPWMAASVLLGAPSRLLSDWLRHAGRHVALSRLLGLLGIAESAGIVVLVVVAHLGLVGLFAARVGAQFVTLLLLLWVSRPLLSLRFGNTSLRRLVTLGAPIGGLHVLMVLRELDRYVIARLASAGAAGNYDMAARLSAPFTFANTALILALEPEAYRARKGAEAQIRRFAVGYVVVLATLAFAAAMIAPELLALVAPGYGLALAAVPGLLFVDVAEGVRRLAGLGGELAERTGLWGYAAAVNVAVGLGLTLVLVPRFGIAGAATGLLCGTLASALVASLLGRRVHPLTLPIGRAVLVVALGAALAAALLVGVTLGYRLLAAAGFALLAFAVMRPGSGHGRSEAA
jgi:O-antigen/teichoic acid export membrane protein